jgi:hypothetical protein
MWMRTILPDVNPRKLICLLALVFIALASFCLVPAGHGPYSVVYGPRAPLRAYRASLQLMQAIIAIEIVSLMRRELRPGCANLMHFGNDPSAFLPLPSLISALRC